MFRPTCDLQMDLEMLCEIQVGGRIAAEGCARLADIRLSDALGQAYATEEVPVPSGMSMEESVPDLSQKVCSCSCALAHLNAPDPKLVQGSIQHALSFFFSSAAFLTYSPLSTIHQGSFLC